ncbi:hypothetical protein ACWF0M_04150 [Kribbella sp. NPDC055110]
MLRGRSAKGHWFGTVIDAPDPQALLAGYAFRDWGALPTRGGP